MTSPDTLQTEATERPVTGLNATLVAALRKWEAYDALLRTVSSPNGILFGGQMAKVDAAYDDCVQQTAAALAASGDRS